MFCCYSLFLVAAASLLQYLITCQRPPPRSISAPPFFATPYKTLLQPCRVGPSSCAQLIIPDYPPPERGSPQPPPCSRSSTGMELMQCHHLTLHQRHTCTATSPHFASLELLTSLPCLPHNYEAIETACNTTSLYFRRSADARPVCT